MPCSTPGCKSKKRVEDRGGGLQLCDACEAERQRAVDDVGSSGSDGEDEAQDGESDSEAGEQEHQIIVNELLCYAFTYIDSAAPEMVIKSIEQFYTVDEIHAVKELLWQEYGKILKNTKSRRRDSVRTAAAAEAEDIVLSGVMVIMNALVELPIKFCALNLRRVSRFSPEELNLQSIVNRLSVVDSSPSNKLQAIDWNNEDEDHLGVIADWETIIWYHNKNKAVQYMCVCVCV